MSKPFPEIGPRFTPGLDARHDLQVARYKDGVANGSLDASEQAALQARNEQAKGGLAAMKYDDGVIDAQERITAHKFLNQTSKEIFTYKHDVDEPKV